VTLAGPTWRARRRAARTRAKVVGVDIEFQVAGETFTLPEEAVVVMAEELRRIKTSDEASDEGALAMANKLERKLVGAYDGPVRVTRENALTILHHKSLDALAVGGVSGAREMHRAITATSRYALPIVDPADPAEG
jgi:hypothetical protein